MQQEIEWNVVEERKAKILKKKAEADNLVKIIEIFFQCIAVLLKKSHEILKRGSATDKDDEILQQIQ